MYELNRHIKDDNAKIFSFLRAASRQLLNQISANLDKERPKTAVLPIEVNDILQMIANLSLIISS